MTSELRGRISGAVLVGAVLALVAAACGPTSSSVDEAGTTIGTAPTEVTTPVDPGWPRPTLAALGLTACPAPLAPVYIERSPYPNPVTHTGKKRPVGVHLVRFQTHQVKEMT